MSERYFGSWQRRVVFAGAVTVVAAAAFAAAVATHTSKAAGVRAGVDNSTLVYAITDTPPDIDPNSSAEFVESELFTNTLSRLFDYKTVKRSDGTYVMQSAGYQPVVGSLVTTWTVSPDKKTITVNLRTGVKNYLGDTFDAKDVVYTFDRLLALKGTGTFYESSIGITKPSNIKVVDPHKIVFKLDFPAELFFKMMSIPHMGIVDSVEFKKHATKSDPWAAQWAHTHSVGFGPYYLTQNQQGVQVVLKADPNFWGHKPAIQNVIEKAVPASANRLALLKGGAVDIASYLQPRERISLKGNSAVKIVGFAPAQSHAPHVAPIAARWAAVSSSSSTRTARCPRTTSSTPHSSTRTPTTSRRRRRCSSRPGIRTASPLASASRTTIRPSSSKRRSCRTPSPQWGSRRR